MLEPCQKHPASKVESYRPKDVCYWIAGCEHEECQAYGGSRQAAESDWNFKQQRRKQLNQKKGKEN